VPREQRLEGALVLARSFCDQCIDIVVSEQLAKENDSGEVHPTISNSIEQPRESLGEPRHR